MSDRLVLVVGGTRSGKSEVAEALARKASAPVVYVATGSATDPEMAERIARHRDRRPPDWSTVETHDPHRVLVSAGEATILVDGSAAWVAELMGQEGLWTPEDVAALGQAGDRGYERVLERIEIFARLAAGRNAVTVVVAEESGLGLVPEGAGVRRYLDLAGEATQILARHADRVVLVVAGQAIDLKWPEGSATGNQAAPSKWSTDRAASWNSAPTSEWPPSQALPIAVERGRTHASPHDSPSELRVHGDTMVPEGHLDFAVNVVAQPMPSWLREELNAALDRADRYPDEQAALVALAGLHGRSTDEVLCVNGSAEAFWLLASCLRPARAVCVHPSFTEPEAALRAAGHPVERVYRDPKTFALDIKAVPDDADLVMICNPNNPTGTLDSAETIESLARPGRVLVVDEAFMSFAVGERESVAARCDLSGLVVVRSLTKLWSCPGIRAAYLLAEPELIAALRAARQPWSVNSLALAALVAVSRNTETQASIAREIAGARQELIEALRELPGVRVWPSAANFLLLRVPDGPAVRAGLNERGIAVRRADTFPGLGPDHLRIAVRGWQDNRLLATALREVLE
ncbi:MAG: Rv2231c family pyridoxal phosphate-dependent protein CobC [Actinomycetota bacterium]